MTTTSPNAKIEYAIVCDDLRREDNGKLIIIGVYAKDIQVQKFPAILPLQFVLAIRSYKKGSISIDVRILQENAEIFKRKATVNFDEPDALGLFGMGNFLSTTNKDTELVFQGRIDQSRYKTILKIPIRKS